MPNRILFRILGIFLIGLSLTGIFMGIILIVHYLSIDEYIKAINPAFAFGLSVAIILYYTYYDLDSNKREVTDYDTKNYIFGYNLTFIAAIAFIIGLTIGIFSILENPFNKNNKDLQQAQELVDKLLELQLNQSSIQLDISIEDILKWMPKDILDYYSDSLVVEKEQEH